MPTAKNQAVSHIKTNLHIHLKTIKQGSVSVKRPLKAEDLLF